jgi:transcriptional regulator with XRE-family HTH domain
MLDSKSQALLCLLAKAFLYVVEMPFKDRLKEARLARTPKVTQSQIAALVGVSPQAISGWERGEAMPELDKITTIAQFLGQTTDWLLDNAGGAENVKREVAPAPEFTELKGRLGAPSLPVLGITMGGQSDDRGPDFWMNGETVAHVARPRKLEGRNNVFGLYVDGDSMEPRFFARDLVIVEKATPAPGDDVVIELKSRGNDGEDNPSFIKRFVSRRGSYIVVEQFNPAKEIEFELKEIKNLFRVIPLKELMG